MENHTHVMDDGLENIPWKELGPGHLMSSENQIEDQWLCFCLLKYPLPYSNGIFLGSLACQMSFSSKQMIYLPLALV